ncbi:DUF977 family protein [Escherichia coli]|nr:DUF977 family protein [Escherichia coli]
MAKVFTQEEREKIKGQVVELVRQSGRETLRQLEVKTGATRYLMSVLARELVASGDVYNSGYGLFPSEQARKDWQNARKKLSRAADDPHHLIGHGQGGMGTKAHDLFVLPLCRKHHNELHTDTVAFEEKYGSQLELIFRFIDRALAIGVLA